MRIKLESLIRDCHDFSNDTRRDLNKHLAEKEAVEMRRDNFFRLVETVKDCENLQSNVI
jgi:hypothetical protein